MKRFWTFSLSLLLLLRFSVGAEGSQAVPSKNSPLPSPAIPPTLTPTPGPRTDANGNPVKEAPTGHVTNYDEMRAGDPLLPDPLKLLNGKLVKDVATWTQQRRPEIFRLYENEIYGRVPANLPKPTYESFEGEPGALGSTAIRKNIVIRIGDRPGSPKLNVTLYLPAKASGPVPVLLHATFFGQPSNAETASAVGKAGKAPRVNELGPISEILSRGFGYAVYRYTEVQKDSAAGQDSGLQAMAFAEGQKTPAPNEWGGIAIWAWTASRVMDYFETDHAIDAKRVAFVGHSRLGKTALWVGASDPRFALIFASCPGEMGASLARRDYGETVDDLAANFPWQFAGNFKKYAGHWNDLPVDTHFLIALNAPRPVFVTGGTQDQWADPVGEFQALVEAEPVYRLFGKKGLGRERESTPPLDTPLIDGDLGFHYHTGPHAITSSDWSAFLDFTDKHLQAKR